MKLQVPAFNLPDAKPTPAFYQPLSLNLASIQPCLNLYPYLHLYLHLYLYPLQRSPLRALRPLTGIPVLPQSPRGIREGSASF